MTIWHDTEYKALRLDTSNDLMEHDGQKCLGRHAQARDAGRRAGVGRRRMAELADAAGEYVWATRHWLSAAACFLLAGDGGPMAECVRHARELADAGHIPADQAHVWAALTEREAELRALLAATPAGPPTPAPSADPALQPRP